MISRISLGILTTALAFAIAAPLHAAPATSAVAPVDSITYHIERHNQQVIVKDAHGKTLTTFSAATPALQGLLMWSAVGPAAGTPRPLVLTLKNQNGRRLQSTPILVMCPQTLSLSYHSVAGGTVLAISTTQLNPPDPDYWPSSGLIYTSGTNGHPLGFMYGTVGSERLKYVYEVRDFSIVDQKGETFLYGEVNTREASMKVSSPAGYDQYFDRDGQGTLELNGTSIAIDKVTEDGKASKSFPWKNHSLVVAEPCSWSVTLDGKLTVSAPSTAKTTASK